MSSDRTPTRAPTSAGGVTSAALVRSFTSCGNSSMKMDAIPASTIALGATPLVSVVICTFNGGPLLTRAVRSIVEQTYPHLEILVIDDGSNDGSVEQAQAAVTDPRVRWLHQPRLGKSAAL